MEFEDRYFFKLGHTVLPGLFVAGRFQIRDLGARGEVTRDLPESIFQGGGRAALAGFKLFYTGERDHHVDEFEVEFINNDRTLRVALNDRNNDDVFGYLVDFIVLSSAPVSVVETGTSSGSAEGGDRVELPRDRVTGSGASGGSTILRAIPTAISENWAWSGRAGTLKSSTETTAATSSSTGGSGGSTLPRSWSRRRDRLLACACLTLVLASCGPAARESMLLQLRWCVLQGSAEAAGGQPGELVTTHRKDGEALARASEIWGAAGIGFISVVTRDEQDRAGVPVIRDPLVRTGEAAGEIASIGGDPFEAAQAAMECEVAWRRMDPDLQGVVVVTARRFIQAGQTLAGASRPNFGLWTEGSHPLAGRRGDDLCGHPRHLSPTDVYDMDGLDGTNVGWLVVAQPDQFNSLDHRSRALAHELGHVLFLSHGNGLDDNGDGGEVGADGPRRFDGYCDPLGSENDEPVEDQQTPFETCVTSSSLMGRSATCSNLTGLQVEQAKAVAQLLPGCNGVPCREP